MSEVTGSIGSESVRLRGMALEETQRQILMAIRGAGQSKGIFGAVGEEAGVLGGKLGKFSSVIGIVTKAGGVLLDTLKAVTGGLDSLVDQIRAADSGIRQSSTNLRILAANTALSDNAITQATSKIYKFAAEGIGQLEEQFDVYKKLSNIGGVVAGDFDNLRINASALGVNMQEYAQLMQENFMNLRLGGRSARSAMLGVKDIATAMRESGEEYNNQFMRLGIGANDYGKVILENSMLLGGLAQAEAGTNKKFIDRMLATTKSVTQLGDAFGFNREVVMKAANDALQDARNRTIYNNIREAGKEQMLSLMTGLFGGDAQKGMRATIAAYTGRFDEQTAVLAGIAPDLIDKLRNLSREVAGGTSVMEAIQKVDLQPTITRLKNSSYGMSQAALDNSGSFGIAANAVINFTDLFGDLTKVQERLKESTESVIGKNADNLDALGRFQRENIKMAVSMSMANKTLNNFGLSIALGTQVMTTAMSRIAREISVQADPVVNEMVKAMTTANKTATDYVNAFADGAGESIDKMTDEFLNKLKNLGLPIEGLITAYKDSKAQSREAGGGRNNSNGQGGANPPPSQPGAANPQNQQQNTPPRATLGPAANSMLGQIERIQHARENTPVDQRRDEPIKITYSVDKGADSSRQVDEIRRLMDQANLKQGVDYKLDSNYDSQKGKIDVQFLSQDAANKFAAAANKIRVAPTAPSAPAPNPNPAAVVSQSSSPSQSEATASSASVEQSQVNTRVAQDTSQVNTGTANVTALLDQNNKWLEKFERIHADDTTRVINKLETLAQDMRRLTA